MEQHAEDQAISRLAAFIGEWRMDARFKDIPATEAGASVVFEWLPGERFLIERWELPLPEAPDGIAIIGADPENHGDYLQHYFDSRGTARLYAMTFGGRIWTLERTKPDFSPLDFGQRFTGRVSEDGTAIAGEWQKSAGGQPWTRDYGLTYTRFAAAR